MAQDCNAQNRAETAERFLAASPSAGNTQGAIAVTGQTAEVTSAAGLAAGEGTPKAESERPATPLEERAARFRANVWAAWEKDNHGLTRVDVEIFIDWWAQPVPLGPYMLWERWRWPKWDTGRQLEEWRKHKVTGISLVPTIYKAAGKHGTKGKVNDKEAVQ